MELDPGNTRRSTALDEQQSGLLFNTMLQGVIFQDADGKIITMNPAAERILGRTLEECMGQSSLTVEPDTIREDGSPFPGPEHPAIVSLRTGREVNNVVLGVFNPRERDYRWIMVTAVPLFKPGKERPYQVYTLFTDITERKKSEEALRKSEELYRTVFENSRDGFALTEVLYDDDGKPMDSVVLKVNQAFEELTGFKAEDIIGKRFSSYAPKLEQSWLDVQDAILRSGRSVHFESYREDSGRWFDIYMFPYSKNTFGQLFRNITARKKAEEALKEANETLEAKVQERTEELRRSNDELQQFAYVASHDLQEPLRMVSSYLQLLEKREGDRLDKTSKMYIGFAVDGAKRMKVMIDEILVYSQVESRGGEFAPVDMNAALSIVLNDLSVSISESRASVIHETLPTVTADKGQMVLLMENLIGNAIKYRSEAAPVVHVSAHRAPREWVFSVKDNGIGIEPRYLPNLFKMFHRLHTMDEYDGTGMGLAIARKIVERHGGRIWVDSAAGKGSTFFFSIPLG